MPRRRSGRCARREWCPKAFESWNVGMLEGCNFRTFKRSNVLTQHKGGAMTERQGAFTISTRLLLSSEQRARLERLVLDQRIDLADLVSMVVADHCAALPRVVSARPSGAATVPVRLFLTPSARQQ